MTFCIGRREFITILGGAAAAWPVAARAQQPDRVRRIGVLMAFAESDREAQSWVAAFREELSMLGWTGGRNIEIDTRWATADVESMQRFAKELVALQSDLILTSSTPATAAMPVFPHPAFTKTLSSEIASPSRLSPLGFGRGPSSPHERC
jgi:putative ABC transport system substrate-binding protein